jgi:tripeptide aminopeptidase
VTTDAATPRVLSTFLEAVRIDSPSGEEAQFGAWCADRLRSLGFTVRIDDTADAAGSDSGNLIAERAGDVPGLTVVLSAHLDTVGPGRGIEPVVEEGVVRSVGQTVLGADDKAGVAAILEALQRAADSGMRLAPVRVLLTTGEERGLQGAKALAPAECHGDLCLVLDAHGSVGGVVTSAPTQYTFSATFTGIPAHAGVEPEKGISAIAMACDAVSHMRIGRLDADTTANVGEIGGGNATNVITSSCAIRGECRSLDRDKVESVRAEMERAMRDAAERAGGGVETNWVLEYEGYRLPEGHPMLEMLERALAHIGRPAEFFSTGGGSDANVFAARGLTSVVLACGMTDVHGTEESIKVDDLIALSDLLETVLGMAVSS